jgi:hypothetical protein
MGQAMIRQRAKIAVERSAEMRPYSWRGRWH